MKKPIISKLLRDYYLDKGTLEKELELLRSRRIIQRHIDDTAIKGINLTRRMLGFCELITKKIINRLITK